MRVSVGGVEIRATRVGDQLTVDIGFDEGKHHRGNGGKFDSSGMHSTHVAEPHPFVTAFSRSHPSGAAKAAHLKTVSDDKLRTAHSILSKHVDGHSNGIRHYVEAEMKQRGIKAE